jgi:hypothetical protein
MEHVMEMGTFWKLKTIGYLSHTFQHMEGPDIAWAELAPRLSNEREGGVVEKTKPHPITHRGL